MPTRLYGGHGLNSKLLSGSRQIFKKNKSSFSLLLVRAQSLSVSLDSVFKARKLFFFSFLCLLFTNNYDMAYFFIEREALQSRISSVSKMRKSNHSSLPPMHTPPYHYRPCSGQQSRGQHHAMAWRALIQMFPKSEKHTANRWCY